jgi:hypothetical protein
MPMELRLLESKQSKLSRNLYITFSWAREWNRTRRRRAYERENWSQEPRDSGICHR